MQKQLLKMMRKCCVCIELRLACLIIGVIRLFLWLIILLAGFYTAINVFSPGLLHLCWRRGWFYYSMCFLPQGPMPFFPSSHLYFLSTGRAPSPPIQKSTLYCCYPSIGHNLSSLDSTRLVFTILVFNIGIQLMGRSK